MQEKMKININSLKSLYITIYFNEIKLGTATGFLINNMVRESNGLSIYGGPITKEIGIYSGRINSDSDLGYVWK